MKYGIQDQGYVSSDTGIRFFKVQIDRPLRDYELDQIKNGEMGVFDTEAERDAKYDKLVFNASIIDKSKEGKASLEVSALIATLAAYATEFKNGKVVQILTVLNQVGRAIFDKIENETTVNQDYEVLLHSMLIEMYANHRELYTTLFAEEKIEEVYETKVVVDFFKVIFTNKYITT